jgi:ribosomal protein S18 acetylase RimI-like enzyme
MQARCAPYAVSMTIVIATHDNADAVVALWGACGLTRPWNDPAADFARAVETVTSTILVWRDGCEITGSVMAGYDGHRGWVYHLAVAEAERGRGAGRALMIAAEDWLRRLGAPKIQLMVRDTNVNAQAFYKALDYEHQPVTTWGKWLDKSE